MRRRIVVLLVDALGWDLVQGVSRLLAAFPHRRRLETILGFSSGALPTLFTGRSPAEHGRWLMYRRAGAAVLDGGTPTPFAGFGALRRAPRRLQRSWKLGRLLARVVEWRGVRGYFRLYDVPRWLLPEFDLAERGDIFEPGGLPVDSLWDTLERRGTRWRGWNWRTPEEEALAALAARLDSGDEEFLFCYTAALDADLHREGSLGPGVRRRAESYAGWVRELQDGAARRGESLWIYLLSDHGMVDVHATIDVMRALAGLAPRWPEDYLAFFDSTMARFWWRRPGARETVRAALAGLRGGRWIDDRELEAAGARFPGREYGEDIFLLDPGVLMVPSFMGCEAVAAMHGYDPAHPDMAALLMSNRPIPEAVRGLRDVRAFLESELEAAAAAPGPEAA
ncbi:MAG TPA: alkaline phosphatase family protein [Candidatus Eisenbacteria bacterium]